VEKNLTQSARIEKEISGGARARTMREDRLLSRDRWRWLPEQTRAFENFSVSACSKRNSMRSLEKISRARQIFYRTLKSSRKSYDFPQTLK
jgi:hypothetical protein